MCPCLSGFHERPYLVCDQGRKREVSRNRAQYKIGAACKPACLPYVPLSFLAAQDNVRLTFPICTGLQAMLCAVKDVCGAHDCARGE